jgi:CTP:molybdopterin cytidylyltransferase MocA
MTGAAGLERVVVVLGARAGEIEAAVGFGRAEPVLCQGWQEGIAASLRCAVERLPGADPLVIALGDQPGLTPAAIGAVLKALAEHREAPAARATYAGVPGHPVAVRSTLRAALLRLRGDAGAARLLVDAGALEVECSGLATPADVDTRAQLEALRG